MKQRGGILSALVLFVGTLALYWPATGFSFVNFDDGTYVYENPWVNQGVTVAGIKWAFGAHAANWHPLTWISHMLDCSLYGLAPGGHHFTNILLHALNALLLFLVLDRLTRARWPSWLVAALFAWHPLRVESVAWVAERKDVLSTFFLFLTLLAYERYAARPHLARYLLTLALFALGLMCKPMLVTLPFLLLLLDFWPLQRLRLGSANGKLLAEKIPFLLLAAAAAAVTIMAQHAGGAVKTLTETPLALRCLNALAAYGAYGESMIWPAGLCAYYPMPQTAPVLAAVVSGLFVLTVSWLAFRARATRPWFLAGWLWFLGALVPVIGLVQVGAQARADRYTYVPLIGLFIILAWEWQRFRQKNPMKQNLGIGAAAAGLLACGVLTEHQLPFWKDGIAMFGRVLAVGGNSAFAQNGLGVALSNAGRGREAISHYEETLRLQPNSVMAHYDAGIELAALGQLDKAASHFTEALKLNPHNESLHNNLGVILARQGKLDAALEHFREAIQISPEYPKSYFNYAMGLEKQGKTGAAITNYALAIKLDSTNPDGFDKLARIYATTTDAAWRNPSAAIKFAQRAVELTSQENPAYLGTLATAYAAAGRFPDAVTTGELARRKAQAAGLTELATNLEENLRLYRAGQSDQP